MLTQDRSGDEGLEAGDERDALTIDDLARETGMTVRNIRAHQSRGLLDPPRVRGRTGYYGPNHVARLRLIQQMQADGLNLRAIERLIESARGQDEELLDFRSLVTTWETERPEIYEAAELIERFGPLEPDQVRRAEKLGLIRLLGDDRFEVPSPTLLRAGQELAGLGIPPEVQLKILERMRRNAEGVAAEFVRVFMKGVWQPFQEAGMPEGEWPRVRETLERLRPLASESLLAVFNQAMTAASEAAIRERERQVAKGTKRKG